MSKEQITLDGRAHDVHWQRNQSNPFYTGSATPALDAALGIQHTAKSEEVLRDATGRVVTKAEAVSDEPLIGKIYL